MQGQAHVGACVRFIDGAPAKSHFRHFNIKTVHKPDDYAALQEIVTRRYKKTDDLPDLIMIDGGKGQLSAVQKVFQYQVPIVSLAKNGERLFSTSTTEVPHLTAADSTGKLLIALRDYAHHFAIEHHRRKQKITK
jgi:excinuclease ABC subunit C